MSGLVFGRPRTFWPSLNWPRFFKSSTRSKRFRTFRFAVMVLAPLRLRCCDIKCSCSFGKLRASTLQRRVRFSTRLLCAFSVAASLCEAREKVPLGPTLPTGTRLQKNQLPRCSGKRVRMLFSFASQMPRSVISPVTSCRGVTSNPKFAAGLFSGVTRTSTCWPSCSPSA
jgi:hypothetical protein